MVIFKTPLNIYQKVSFLLTVFLCVYCVAWEWFLSPLRPHGSLMVFKFIPLAFLLPGLYRGANYQLQALSMVILLYFFEAVARVYEKGLNPWLAGIELIISLSIFFCVLKHLGPIKKAAKKKVE